MHHKNRQAKKVILPKVESEVIKEEIPPTNLVIARRPLSNNPVKIIHPRRPRSWLDSKTALNDLRKRVEELERIAREARSYPKGLVR